MASPPVFSLYTDPKFCIWRKYGANRCSPVPAHVGGVESLCELPSVMTHASVPPEQRAELGISDAAIRLSVGVENEEDLVNDVMNALEAIEKV